MHYLYFVAVPKKRVEDKKEAMEFAEDFLDANNFTDQDGLYSAGKADWFEIGGRWSGYFNQFSEWFPKWEEQKNALVKSLAPAIAEDFSTVVHFGDKAKDALKHMVRKEVLALWKKKFAKKTGISIPPEARHGTFAWEEVDKDCTGPYSDNAIIPTLSIFKKWKKDCPECEIVFTDESRESCIADIHFKDVKGHYIVIIDYHN